MSLIPWEEALDRLIAGTDALSAYETIGLRALSGRVASHDVLARHTQPSFDASAMDGYAVRAQDVERTPVSLRVIGESAAGAGFCGQLDANEAVRIFTGAPMPSNANAVVIQENTVRVAASIVEVLEPAQRQKNVRPAGNDFTRGETLVGAGCVFGPASIALVASGGHAEVSVLRRPRVGILMTGNELVQPNEPLGSSQIVASNGYGIAAIVEAAGGIPFDFGIARDDEAEICTALRRADAEQLDAFVTIGGASVGDHDLVAPVFRREGVELDFWKVAMRPGKPMMAGRRGLMRFLGLPGNPASSLVTAELFLKPLVLRLAGRRHEALVQKGYLGTEMPANDHRTEFVRSTVEITQAGRFILHPLARQDSSLLSTFAKADALLLRPSNAPNSRIGSPCEFIRLSH